MRIAVLVIGLCIAAVTMVQSCVAVVGGSLGESLGEFGGDTKVTDEAAGLLQGGGAGMWAALFAFMGAGFVLKFPRVSVFLFFTASLIAFSGAASSAFDDLYVWGSFFMLLAGLSYFALPRETWIPFRRSTPVEPPEPALTDRYCPQCGDITAAQAKFCSGCGTSVG